jgi:hypothetical protein
MQVLQFDQQLPGAPVVHRNLADTSKVLHNLVYQKGGWVLHMLRHLMGYVPFFAGLRTYADNHRLDNATTEDFIAVMQAAAGQDLSWFFEPWLRGVGHPVYEPRWQVVELATGEASVTLDIDQVQTTGTRFTMPMEIEIRTPVGNLRQTVTVDSTGPNQFVFLAPAAPTALVLDPDNKILKGVRNPSAGTTGPAVALARIFPNPSHGVSTRIELDVTSPGFPLSSSGEAGGRPLSLLVYDVRGRLVRTLANGVVPAGQVSFLWDGRGDDGRVQRSGVYLLRMSSEGAGGTARIVLAR